MEDGGGFNEVIGGERRYAIDFRTHTIVFFDFFQQQAEIAVTRQQYDGVNIFRQGHDINGYTHVPIAFGGAVAALDIGFEFYRKADLLEGILKFELFFIAPMNGIGNRRNNLAFRADTLPELLVVKLAAISFASRVINVLHIGKERDFFHKDDGSIRVGDSGDRLAHFRLQSR